jgi:hypothetical protein
MSGMPSSLPRATASRSTRESHSEHTMTESCLHLLTVLRDYVAQDHRLRGAQVKILVYLLPELLDRRHRLVKQIVLARALRMDQGVISDSLNLLVKLGHLERGPKEGAGHTYRLSPVLLSRFPYRKGESSAP